MLRALQPPKVVLDAVLRRKERAEVKLLIDERLAYHDNTFE